MRSIPRTSPRRNTRLAIAGIASLVSITCVALTITGCPKRPDGPRYQEAGNSTPRSGGTFVFHHESNVRTLEPHIAYDELSGMAVRLVFDGLLDYDHDAQMIPSIAVAMPTVSNEGKTFQFRLRDDVRFHPMPGLPEGRPIVAEDVNWSMHRLLSKDVGSPGYPFFKSIVGAEAYHRGEAANVTGIRVIDTHTIAFDLMEADQTFLNAMAMTFAYPVPKENYEHWGDEVKYHPVGTGPFVFEEWERGVQISFTRNRRYRDSNRANPDRMIFQENLSRGVAALRFQNGGLDSIHRQNTADFLLFKQSEKWAPYRLEYPRVSTFGIGMNCEIAPFDNVHIRRAVAHAIDRAGWSRARSGRLAAATQILPPQLAGYDENLEHAQRYDLELAREEMRLAGHPDGLDEEIVTWVTEGDVGRIYGELFQQDMEKIGLNIRVRQVSFATYLAETGKPRQVQAFFTGWNMDFPDPSNFIDILFHSRSIHPENSENRAFYRNPEVDRLLDEGRAEVDRERRLSLYRQANNIIAHDAPWAFTYYPMTMEVWQPYVKNYRPHPIWSEDYRDVWLDLPRRRADARFLGTRFPNAVPAWAPFGGVRSFARGTAR